MNKEHEWVDIWIGTITIAIIFFTIILFSATTKAQTEEASTTKEIIIKQKTDFEILKEQAETIAHKDLLISKYAQKLDTLRSTCNK